MGSYLQHRWKGLFLLFFGLWAVAFGVGVISSGPTHLTRVVSQHWADQLSGPRVPEHVGTVRVRRLSVVFAEFALSARLEGSTDARAEAAAGSDCCFACPRPEAKGKPRRWSSN